MAITYEQGLLDELADAESIVTTFNADTGEEVSRAKRTKGDIAAIRAELTRVGAPGFDAAPAKKENAKAAAAPENTAA